MNERAEWVSTDGRETIEDGQLWQAVAQGVARVVESTAMTVTVHWLDDARTTMYRYRLAGGTAEGGRPAGDYSRGAAADTMRDNADSRDLGEWRRQLAAAFDIVHEPAEPDWVRLLAREVDYSRANHLPPQGQR